MLSATDCWPHQVELAGEEMIERVLDDLHELVPDAPKVRTVGPMAVVDPAIVFGLDAALWRSSRGEGEGEGGGGGGVLRAATADEATHMDAEAECHHVLPRGVPPGWSTSRAALEALLKVAPPDELYRTKGIVPFTLVEAEAEAARQGLPAPTAALRTQLGDTWWLFNGVAGRLTLEPLAQCAGPASLVFMGHSLGRAVPRIEKALGLPSGAVTSVSAATPIVRVQLGQRLVACGAARGLSAPEVPTMAPTPIE